MSDLLTHWASFDDLRRILLYHPQVEKFFSELMDSEQEAARLGAITRWGSHWVPAILTRYRSYSHPEITPRVRQKLAFALGGIAHFAADMIMKPVQKASAMRVWEYENPGEPIPKKVSIREVSAYYDICVFKEVYANGQKEPFSEFFIRYSSLPPAKVLEDLARTLLQRSLLACHTLAPSRGGIDEWLDALFDQLQTFYVDLELYTKIYTQPDPVKMDLYRVYSFFYRPEDPFIQLARRIQQGENLSPNFVLEWTHNNKPTSAYGQILELGLRTMIHASAWWRGEISELPDLSQG